MALLGPGSCNTEEPEDPQASANTDAGSDCDSDCTVDRAPPPPPPPAPTRCRLCVRRVTLALRQASLCPCGDLVCPRCRDDHVAGCTHDWRGAGRARLSRSVVGVRARKVEKI
jgi:hypothetical protein